MNIWQIVMNSMRVLQNMGRHETPEELIETLRTWEDMFYSESETKLIMNQAANLIESLMADTDETLDVLGKLGDEHIMSVKEYNESLKH